VRETWPSRSAHPFYGEAQAHGFEDGGEAALLKALPHPVTARIPPADPAEKAGSPHAIVEPGDSHDLAQA
jgi:hypothetical protein